VAANGQLGEKSVRMWRKGDGEPSVEKLAVLCALGLDASWYLLGEGTMFSDTPRGREYAKEHGVHVDAPRKRQPDRSTQLIAEIDKVLSKYR
jgi:hypothetical protein